MNDLLKSYAILQLTPGTSMELINQRYKKLVMSWHPDKFRGEQAKATAERELKTINNARDILRDHFRTGGHKESGNCECRHAPEKAPQAEAEAEPSTRSKNQGASNATSSYQSTNSADQTNDTSKSSSFNDTSDRFDHAFASGNPFHNAFRTRPLEPDGLRWRVSLVCAFFFLLLLATTVVSDVFAVTTEFVRNGFKARRNNSMPALTNRSDRKPPTASGLNQNDRSADSQWFHDNFAVLPSRDSECTEQDFRNTTEDIERYSSAVHFSQKKLADSEAILATPGINALDRQFALSDRELQTKFLIENQENLKYTRKRLDDRIAANRPESR